MNYQTNIYEIQENGRCKVDLELKDLNLFISGFVVVPGPNGKGAIVHMPKGMGSDWQYKEIEWAYVRNIISAEYFKNHQISEILSALFVDKTKEGGKLLSTKAQKHEKLQDQVESTDLFVNLYNFDEKSGDCMAGIILPKSKIRIEGFKVKNDKTGGLSVYMPQLLGTTWRYDEISWKNVRQKITQQYQKEREYVDTVRTTVQDRNGFVTEFYSCSIEYKYEILIHVINENDDMMGFLFIKNEKIRLDIPSYGKEKFHEMGIEMKEVVKLSKKAFDELLPVCDNKNLISIKIGDCISQTVNANVDFSLPNSEYIWKNFFIKQVEDGSIIVSLPSSLNKKWINPRYPWNVLCDMLKSRFCIFWEKNSEEKIITVDEMKDLDKKTEEVFPGDVEENTIEKRDEMSEKKKQFLAARNHMQRVRNAENTAFAFVPHSILKLVDVSIDRIGLTRRIVNAINSSNGGIGPLEIEILEWVSKLKYLQKTMILDLVLSGYISLGERNSITANKMTDIMNRLYKYDLIESSNFVAVDDDGNPLTDRGSSIYRVHTLGATGYKLLREMGRHPERRNPFGVLADGNTVKKHLSANQWLVYWLTHYDKRDILDYSVNTNIYLIGLKWNGAKIYASINLDTISIVAEPVRRCEEFEMESDVVTIQEKMIRVIELFDNEDQLYTSTREQIVYPTRPIIAFVCEDDDHMEKVAKCIASIIEQYKQQEVWFTTDIRMYNYDCKGERFFELEDGKMTVINLKERIGLEEMSMEERGGWVTEM